MPLQVTLSHQILHKDSKSSCSSWAKALCWKLQSRFLKVRKATIRPKTGSYRHKHALVR